VLPPVRLDVAGAGEGRKERRMNERKTHELKTVPPYYEQVRNEIKPFELRKNDREFDLDDYLLLREYIPGGGYTGRQTLTLVTYLLEGYAGLESGYCIMGVEKIVDMDDTDRARRDNIAALSPQPGVIGDEKG
jgi:hypothetical protein